MTARSIIVGVCIGALGLCGCAKIAPPQFDGESAFAFLRAQCDLGPRYPGSPGHAAVERYIMDKLTAFGASVSTQPFDAVPSTGDTLHLVNIIARLRPGASKRILLGAHYDTRPRADRDGEAANRSKPIPGANDGASGVAVLLEIARLLGASEPPLGVDLVFFDGEDYGEEGNTNDYLFGSRRYAASLGPERPLAVIVLDMIGRRDVRIPLEGFSAAASAGLCARIYGIAEKLGVRSFVRSQGPSIVDDHLPFIQAGLPAVDLIDFDYPYWHTLADTPDKCAPESLASVGCVLVRFIWEAR
ncbi:MAG TPA: M28 family peptidase [Candidatus Bathyarchaeia archaeon]|nr:M28 family peptidase [Candidatus Bathyarchaeia archaeon]